jgi:DNA mismatch endonuclease (patch repair protein)
MLTDIFTPEKRSWVMSRIRGTNTKIDLRMKEILAEMGYRFEMYPKMYGNPDFVLKRKKIIIYCDGDFWHGFKYEEKKKPMKKFWREKIENNMRRDRKYTRKLRREGWSVLRFWEHDIEKNPEKCIRRITSKYRSK